MHEPKESNSRIDEQRFQILSLDGGGVKGLFSAVAISAIEEDLNISVVDHFDLITGTSTGGIIALGLGIGMPLGPFTVAPTTMNPKKLNLDK